MKFVLFLFLTCFIQYSEAQESYTLELITIDTLIQDLPQFNRIEKFDSEKDIYDHLQQLIRSLRVGQYYTASLDCLKQKTEKYFVAELYVGRKFKMISFDQTQLDSNLVEGIESIDRLFIEFGKQISKSEKEGYPFAKLGLRNTKILEDSISGELYYDKGKQILFDNIIMQGDVNLRPNYLFHYLNIKKGDLFNKERMLDVNQKLNELPFLELEKSSTLEFFDKWASLNIYAKNKNASRFDFIFGIIPTDEVDDQSLFVSLDITAEMINKLGLGEYLYFEFERLRPEQQSLILKLNYPYILDLPIAIDGNFRIFRNALDYLNLFTDAGIQYIIDQHTFVKLLWSFSSSRLIEIDTTTLFQTQTLPQDLDFSQTGLGLALNYRNLDYRFNPRNGFELAMQISGGRKTIKESEEIKQLSTDDFSFENSFDTLSLSNFGLNLDINADYFIPIGKRATLNMGVKSGWRYSGSKLLRNEVYQIGGYQTFRGFDEASIFTSLYIIPHLEYRLLIAKNSYFTLPFIDVGYIKNLDNQFNFGYGFGGGLSFETDIGLFNFSIATGTLGDIELDFGRPKAHFGFVSIF